MKIGPVSAPNRFYAVPHATGHGWNQPTGAIALREMKAQIGVKGFKKVKDWLPSFDHHINVAFADASKNPVIAKTALDNISLVPAKDNMVKGFGYDGDKLFNGAVYEYENALPKEKLSKLDQTNRG